MRVLFLVPDLFGRPGGIARYCCLVVKALTEAPQISQVDVVALHDSRPETVDGRYVGPARFSYTACQSNQVLFLAATAAHLVRRRYDLVLSGHAHLTPLLFLLYALNARRNQVTFAYGVEAWDRLPWQRRLPLRWSKAIIAISHFTGERVARANGIPQDRVRILHNCLDPVLGNEHLNAPSKVGTQPVILTVARLSRAESSKGHLTVIQALPRIILAVPEVRYEVVGEGDLRPDLERLAREFGVEDHVYFAGYVDEAELDRHYARCTVFAMPSKGEGFGFVFLEAMAHGKPVVAGTVDAGPEVLGNDAGVLVPPDDVDAVAAAIVQLLSDRDLRERLGRSGRERVGSLFGYERFQTELLRLLARVRDG